MIDSNDTIAAIATAPGPAGLAVVRVSGSGALAVADAVVRGRAALSQASSHTAHHGWAVRSEQRIDEVVATVFRAPHSYTREDLVEVSCHGGHLSARRVLSALLQAGARMAQPGEFTLRAFVNGRIDLAQAEAVADLIHASTEAAHDLALAQLSGVLSSELEKLSDRLTDSIAEVEARVDFAEDVGGIEVPDHVVDAIRELDCVLHRMMEGAAYARALREGVAIPLVGRPNVGKSSLFNALLGEQRAIVTAIPGTTRDRVSESIEVAGIPVTLSDTAGLREAAEPVEAIGVERTHEILARSALVMWVVDGSSPLDVEDRSIARRLAGRPLLVALNKTDLGRVVEEGEVAGLLNGAPFRVTPVSAVTGAGLAEVRSDLAELLGAGKGEASLGAAASNSRHAEAMGRARDALGRAIEVAGQRMPGEIVALELREAAAAIGEVLGRAVGEDVLERIFSRFCIGK